MQFEKQILTFVYVPLTFNNTMKVLSSQRSEKGAILDLLVIVIR